MEVKKIIEAGDIFFKKDENEQATLGFGSSYRNDDYFYYSITINYDNVYTFIETVSN